MRALLQLGVLAVTLATPTVAIAQEIPDEFEGPSRVLDLAEVPLGATLMQEAGIFLRNRALKSQLDREFKAFTTTIEGAIGNRGLGYLLEVQLYVNEFGVPLIPGGQLMRPVGVGSEPIDALAEDLRRPRLSVSRPTAARNASYYVWITKQGSLRAGMIPGEWREMLVRAARSEARRRDLLATWKRVLPGQAFTTIQRAEYWQEVVARQGEQLSSDTRRAAVADLNARMSRLQSEVNRLYVRYQELERKIAEDQKQAAALAQIQTVLGILRTGMEVGSLVSSESSRPATPSGNTEVPVAERLEWTKREIRIQNGALMETTTHLRIEGRKLMELDQTLRQTFESDGIRLPQTEPELRLP